MFTITVDYNPQTLNAIRSGIESAVVEIMTELAERTAYVARERHGYTTRTERMEENTLATPPVGSFYSDTLRSAALGFTEYALYLERRRDLAFLNPAARAVVGQVAAIAETAFAAHLHSSLAEL